MVNHEKMHRGDISTSRGEVMARVSEYYSLGRTQGTLDFVDVDTVNDIQVYVDPGLIRYLEDDWGKQCLQMLETFFDSVLDSVRSNDKRRTVSLLSQLREPNETHLGISRGPSAGRGFGAKMGAAFAEKLAESEAAKSGLIQDLEDTAFFIDGVDMDIVSDVTTNIIRGPLITYTQQMAELFEIPLTEGVVSGPVWNPRTLEWENGFTELPTPDGNKLLLVPKMIVRRSMHMSRSEYYRHHLVPVLQEEESKVASRGLAETVRGKVIVTKKEIKKKYGSTKPDVTRETLKRPSVYENYRRIKRQVPPQPLSHKELSDTADSPMPDYDQLLQAVLNVPTGKADATRYHNAVEALLSAVFYPSLSMSEKEFAIHEGRKRVDISYVNTARDGFFRYLVRHRIQSRYVYVECKNYGKEVANPELDQLSSRFSTLRGEFGILTCRSFQDKDLFLRRCCDTARDGRGYVIALDDEDLKRLVADVKAAMKPTPVDLSDPDAEPVRAVSDYPLLHERFRQLHG
ncbi:hypothetical protein AB0L04_15450 [Streptomyces glaucescens]|uniref:hypothetical protein n=1 Tax=Streptomyces glaucescens TaxID=1907 RepID=UPI00344F0B95